MVDVNDMAVFVRVVELSSLTLAGRELRLTPAAVTKRIAKLEQRIGVRLLNRTTRRVSLTEEGAEYYGNCVRILNDIERAETSLTASKGTPHGLLRVTAPTLFGRMWIAPLIPEYLKIYPNVQINLHLTDRLVNILGEGFDLAIRNAPLEDSNLIVRKIAPDRRVICGAPSYLEEHGRPKNLDDLLKHQCLLLRFPGTKQYRWYLKGENGKRVPIPVKGAMDANSSDVLYQWALQGLGLSLRSTSDVSEDILAGRLETVLDKFVPKDNSFNAIYPHRELTPTKVKTLIDFLQSMFGSEPSWDKAHSAK